MGKITIWGFSDDYAWGLATTNPCTVKTLESATFRKCKPDIIQKNLRAIRTIGADISFVEDAPYNVTRSTSQINTNFFVDNRDFIKGTTSNLVYRKEQFSEDDGLSAEYIIRDKRYKMTEIIELLELQGFEIIDSRYVRAGHFDEPLDNTDSHAKEICLVARKL